VRPRETERWTENVNKKIKNREKDRKGRFRGRVGGRGRESARVPAHVRACTHVKHTFKNACSYKCEAATEEETFVGKGGRTGKKRLGYVTGRRGWAAGRLFP